MQHLILGAAAIARLKQQVTMSPAFMELSIILETAADVDAVLDEVALDQVRALVQSKDNPVVPAHIRERGGVATDDLRQVLIDLRTLIVKWRTQKLNLYGEIPTLDDVELMLAERLEEVEAEYGTTSGRAKARFAYIADYSPEVAMNIKEVMYFRSLDEYQRWSKKNKRRLIILRRKPDEPKRFKPLFMQGR